MKFTINKGIHQAAKKDKAYMDHHKQRKRELGSILVRLSSVRDLFASQRQSEMVARPERQPSGLLALGGGAEALSKRKTIKQIFTMDEDEIGKTIKCY